MNLSNCKKCGKLIVKRASYFCENCYKNYTKDIIEIKEYLAKKPFSTIIELHENTGVPLDTINDLILDKRIDYR